MTQASLSRGSATDNLIPLMREYDRLIDRFDEIKKRTNEIRAALPENVREGKVLITFSAGFTHPGKYTFQTEADVKTFAEMVRRLTYRDRIVPHWERIVAQVLNDFQDARKAQIDDVLEASGLMALEEEADSLTEQFGDLRLQILETPASSVEALIWQIGNAGADIDDVVDTIIAGVKRLVPDVTATDEMGPRVIGFGEPEPR